MTQSFYSDAAVAAVGSQLKYSTSVNPLSPPTSTITLTHTFKNTVTEAHKVWDVPCTHGGRCSIIHIACTLPHLSHTHFKYRVAPYWNPSAFKSKSKFDVWSHEGRLRVSVFISLPWQNIQKGAQSAVITPRTHGKIIRRLSGPKKGRSHWFLN